MFILLYINLIISYSFNHKKWEFWICCRHHIGNYPRIPLTSDTSLCMPYDTGVICHPTILSFEIRCLSPRFRTISTPEFKSTAASWNVTLSCLFSSFPLWWAEPCHVVALYRKPFLLYVHRFKFINRDIVFQWSKSLI